MRRPIIVCDFDGTFARADVGYRLFHTFSDGRNEALLPEWKAGRLSSREILTREAAMVRVTEAQLAAFLDTMRLADGAREFVALARANGVSPVILSDGLDLYIHVLLRRAGLADLPVTANHGELIGEELHISFPHVNRECRRCGNCKGERIDELRAAHPGDGPVVFIGDGYSDACAVHRADLVLAKKDLAEYCRSRRIAYTLYDDFHQVAAILREAGLLRDHRV